MNRGKARKAVPKALRYWHQPTRDGLEAFAEIRGHANFGYLPTLPLVDVRIAIDNMLTYYIEQLSRLVPRWHKYFYDVSARTKASRKIAYEMHIK